MRQFFLIVFMVLAFSSDGSSVVISNLIITDHHSSLSISLKMSDIFSDKATASLIAGEAFTIKLFLTLYQKNHSWFDKEIGRQTAVHTVLYQPDHKGFMLMRSWDINSPLFTKSFDDAKKLMTHIDKLPFVPSTDLIKGGKYALCINIMSSKDNTALFWIMRHLKSEWYAIDFIY